MIAKMNLNLNGDLKKKNVNGDGYSYGPLSSAP